MGRQDGRYHQGMSFFAVLFALLAEQLKPLSNLNPIHHALAAWVRWAGRNFDAGADVHARVVWVITVLAPSALLALAYVFINRYSTVLALVFNVAVLYLTLGFRQFSHHFTEIRDALDAGEEAQAREALARWLHGDASSLPRHELVRHVIECSAISAHRHVFGVMTWFSLLAVLGLGPAGAILYRLSSDVQRWWGSEPGAQAAGLAQSELALGAWAERAWKVIDWLPARCTAITFAIVGNFEEAIDCWRHHAQSFPDDNDGVVLAASIPVPSVWASTRMVRGPVIVVPAVMPLCRYTPPPTGASTLPSLNWVRT